MPAQGPSSPADSQACRVVATLAWVAALAVLYVGFVDTYGSGRGGLIVWTYAALPTAVLTRRWLRRLGRRPPPAMIGVPWLLLLIAAFGTGRVTAPAVTLPLDLVSLAFALGVTAWGAWLGASAGRRRPRLGAPAA